MAGGSARAARAGSSGWAGSRTPAGCGVAAARWRLPGRPRIPTLAEAVARTRRSGLNLPPMAERREQGDVRVIERTETKKKVERPRRYKVLLHNDDYTTMEFVVWVLQVVFRHDETTATEIMLHVHRTGLGVAGVYPRD